MLPYLGIAAVEYLARKHPVDVLGALGSHEQAKAAREAAVC